MANPLLLIDFDCNAVLGESSAPTSWPNTMKPVGVYSYAGVLTRNPNIDNNGTFGGVAIIGPVTGRTAGGNGYGYLRNGSTQINSVFESMIGIARDKYAIGSEIYVTFDMKYDISIGGNYSSVQNYNEFCIFRWGSLKINVKTMTFTSPTYTVVFNVYNGASVIATITVPDITSSTWHYVKIRAKLDSTTGLIDASVDGYAQSVAYANQNTLTPYTLAQTGSLLTPDFIYVGPPWYLAYAGGGVREVIGAIDNVTVGTAGYPVGRVAARRWSMGSTSTDSGWAAVGTSPTTVPDALTLPTDAKAARGTGVGANTLITLAGSFDFTGMQEDIIGINVYLKQPASADSFVARHIAVGVSISGVHTMDTVVAAEPLHIDNVVIPPNTNFVFGGLGGGVFTAGITQTNFPNTTIRLLVS